MIDQIEKIGKSVIQHGSLNRRVYLMKLASSDFPAILENIESLAQSQRYTKIFSKVPAWAYAGLRNRGYVQEAFIPAFYEGEGDVFFMSRFIDPDRALVSENDRTFLGDYLQKALLRRSQHKAIPKIREGFHIRVCTTWDSETLASLYKKVFQSYPFPIHDPAYIQKTMKSHIVYFGVFHQDRLVAASSAEMDLKSRNAEMTDFATLHKYRGNSLSSALLQVMEQEMKKRDMATFYTIARALSAGMNITFAKHGYRFSGTLVNNTNISGKIESMNVWYKRLIFR